MKLAKISFKFGMLGMQVHMVRDENGNLFLERNDVREVLDADAARAIARMWNFQELEMTELGLLPLPPMGIPAKRMRRVEFEVPEGAPFELVEIAADYATQFIPMMIEENMAALDTRIRKQRVEQVNKFWSDASDRFVNGTLKDIEHE